MPRSFVSRTFAIGEKDRCTVRFFKPVVDGSDFRCNYEIAFGKLKRSHRAFGVDAIQSLILAMSAAQADLGAGSKANKTELTWLGERDLGLPLWTKRRQLVMEQTAEKPPRSRARKV